MNDEHAPTCPYGKGRAPDTSSVFLGATGMLASWSPDADRLISRSLPLASAAMTGEDACSDAGAKPCIRCAASEAHMAMWQSGSKANQSHVCAMVMCTRALTSCMAACDTQLHAMHALL